METSGQSLSRKGLTIDELMDEKSTFSKVLSSKEPFLFYNSKEQARKLDSYIRDGERSHKWEMMN